VAAKGSQGKINSSTSQFENTLRKKTWKGFSAVSNCKKFGLFPISWLYWTLFSQDLQKTAELISVESANLSGP
jgi:hypothetical protein